MLHILMFVQLRGKYITTPCVPFHIQIQLSLIKANENAESLLKGSEFKYEKYSCKISMAPQVLYVRYCTNIWCTRNSPAIFTKTTLPKTNFPANSSVDTVTNYPGIVKTINPQYNTHIHIHPQQRVFTRAKPLVV